MDTARPQGRRLAGPVNALGAGFRQPRLPVWHPRLTRAAEDGGPALLEEALAAKPFTQDRLRYATNLGSREQHTCARLPDGTPVAQVPQSPFPAASEFGILPYAAWHRHLEILQGLVQAGASLEGKGEVPTEDCYPRHLLPPGEQWPTIRLKAVRATALQIAYYKRDVAAVRALQEAGANQEHPFLLDIIRPRPGSLFATKAGSWSPQCNCLYPPAFKAAAAELLRISRKHGGRMAQEGEQPAWPFDSHTLVSLLLPLLAEDVTHWLDVPSGERGVSEEGGGEGKHLGHAAEEEQAPAVEGQQ